MGGEDGSVCARYRLQTKGTDWLFRFAMALDRGANLRMAGQLPSPRSGLRDQSTHERGLDQNRHDPPYGAKARLSILRQVLSGSFCAGFALVRAIPVPARPCEEASHAASRQVFLDAVAHGSVISWQHINLLGEYDFSDEKLRDSVGIRPPKLTP